MFKAESKHIYLLDQQKRVIAAELDRAELCSCRVPKQFAGMEHHLNRKVFLVPKIA